MRYLALYRRYRPQTFDKLLGQEHIVKTLVSQIKNGRLGHAYLFTGTRGTGKTSTAKIFAKAINCLEPVNGSPCGHCAVCKALNEPSNIDIIEIDAASNNGVNEIRELKENVQYPPVSCKYKVYIIDEVHMLSGAAFNALLKTLEEPPEHVVFILATTEVHKIPATILSRCMRFDFRLVSNDIIVGLLRSIYDEIGKKYEEDALYAIAKAGEGSIRDSLSIADTALSYSSGTLTYGDVMEILSATDYELLIKLISYVINGEVGKIFDMVEELCNLGKSMGVLIKDITGTVRDITVIKTCDDANSLLKLPSDKFAALKKIADITDERRLLRIMEVFSDAEAVLRYSNHPRIIFETACIKAANPSVDQDLDALMSRMKTLEDKLSSFDTSTYKQSVSEPKNGQTTNTSDISTDKAEQTSGKSFDENKESGSATDNGLKTDIANADGGEIKGKLLTALRNIGSEMLWNIMQNVTVKSNGNVLNIIVQDASDYEILNKDNSLERIKEALSVYYNPFEISITQSKQAVIGEKIDEAVDYVKKVFGDDIVIIK